MRTLVLALSAATLTLPALPSAAVARQRGYYQGRTWQDQPAAALRCKRPNGTTGLIVGAAGGALIGRAIDTRGERTTGTVLGAAAGALLGRHVDRSRRFAAANLTAWPAPPSPP